MLQDDLRWSRSIVKREREKPIHVEYIIAQSNVESDKKGFSIEYMYGYVTGERAYYKVQ